MAKDSFLNQVKSVFQLPAAWKGQADAAYNAYSTAKKLKVAQNKKNPFYARDYEKTRKKVFQLK